MAFYLINKGNQFENAFFIQKMRKSEILHLNEISLLLEIPRHPQRQRRGPPFWVE